MSVPKSSPRCILTEKDPTFSIFIRVLMCFAKPFTLIPVTARFPVVSPVPPASALNVAPRKVYSFSNFYFSLINSVKLSRTESNS